MTKLLPVAVLAALSLGLAPQIAFAGEATEANATPPAEASAKPKLVCRKLATTGSRLQSKKICATAAEWELADRAAAKTASKMAGPSGQDLNLDAPR